MGLIKKILLVTLILFVVAIEIFLPRYFSQKLQTNLKEELEDSKELTIKIDSFPAIKLLIGQVDSLRIRGRDIIIDELPIANLKGEFIDLKLKKVNQRWQVVQGENKELYLKLKEKDLNRYLATRSELRVFEKFKLELLKNKVMLVAKVAIFNANFNLQLAGDFLVKDLETIIFNSEKLAVENIVIPTSLIEEVKDKLQFEINFSDVPLPIKVREVNVKEDELEILGDD